MIRVGVSGAAGRMGATVCDAIEVAEGMELAVKADPELGTEVEQMLDEVDVVVDFTVPGVALDNAAACLEAGVHVVIGTTGFDVERLQHVAETTWADGSGPRAFVAPNFAIGAVLMMEFSKQAAQHLPECEIIELHHDGKLDVPSGTAARTAELIAAEGGRPHEPIHSVRLPGLVAHQEVIFGGQGETLTIRHDSIDRSSFMPGVILAVRRVAGLERPLTIGLEELL